MFYPVLIGSRNDIVIENFIGEYNVTCNVEEAAVEQHHGSSLVCVLQYLQHPV
jgi:hypothetical protein